MHEGENKREFTRVRVGIHGVFADKVGDVLTVDVDSLSLRGCHALTGDPLPAGGPYALTLFTDEAEDALHLRVDARIVRVEEWGMGVEFLAMPPESYEHLRRLVLLNAPDPQVVEREFREHLGLHRAA